MDETKKPMNFEEWSRKSGIPIGEWGKTMWNNARLNMIPADRAVEIPEVWPDDAMYISVQFRTGTDDYAGSAHEDIPRPTPAWTPKIGEAVFCLSDESEKQIYIGKVLGVGANRKTNFLVKTHDGQTGDWTPEALKPFSESAIGKSWSEI